MFFASVKYSFLFILIPFLIFAIIYKYYKKKKLLSKFADISTSIKLMKFVDYNKMKFKDFLIVISVIFIIFALMQPQFGYKKQIITKQGIDIVFCLDVSKSMLAEDIKPNRLEKAKYEISKLVKSFTGDRVGLTIFSGTAFVQVPLTLDYAVFNMFLDNVTTDSIELPGTNISEALEKSVNLFNIKETTSKVIILLTDGENTVGDSIKIAKKASEMNIKIYTVGVGSTKGSMIPFFDKNGKRDGFKKDSKGNIVTTKLDVKTLQKIALETNANSYISGSGEMDLGKILRKISKSEKKSIQSKHYGIYEDQFQWPLLIGIISLIISTFLSESKKKMILIMLMFGLFANYGYGLTNEVKSKSMQPEHLVKKQKIPPVSLFTSFFDSNYKKIVDGIKNYNNEKYDKAYQDFNKLILKQPQNKEIHLNTASALYKNRKYDDAIKEFQEAIFSKNIDIKAKAYYDIGNSYFRKKDLAKSLEFYKKCLELKPSDNDAKYNIEVVRKKMKENAKKQKQNQRKQNQKNQKKKDKNQKNKNSKDKKKKKDNQSQNKSDKKKNSEKKDKKKSKQQKKNDKQQQPKDKKKMSKKEAEKLLKQIMDKEKDDLKRKHKKIKGSGNYNIEKDW